MTSIRADLKKQCKAVEDSMTKHGIDAASADPKHQLHDAAQALNDIMQCNIIYTLLTRIRNPTIRNPKQETLRQHLRA
eukprot:2220540-Lingulodinium_polyedra.AAC.1